MRAFPTPEAHAPQALLELAVEAARTSALSGGGPFGALLVPSDGGPSFIDTNHVTELSDPTAHAEVSVIRQACAALGRFSLEGYTLYSSCEPCPMCLGAALWARVDRVYYAADREDAALAGFDDSLFYQKLQLPGGSIAEPLFTPEALAPFAAWADNHARVDY